MPQISVIVPMRNEEAHIEACLRSLLAQTLPAEDYEIIAVDGNSCDRSAEIVSRLQADAPNLRLLVNPQQIMPTAMNIGLRAARGRVVLVAGAHTTYPPDYLAKCLHHLGKTGADVVGGPLITVARGDGFAARMTSAILSSRFGVGNSEFRTCMKEGLVDTVPFGAYRKEAFDRWGYYNEKLVRSQDHELHARIRRHGGRIYQTPDLTTFYHPVHTFRELWEKGYATGLWQFFTLRQNPDSFALRHFVPGMFVSFLAVLAATAAWRPVFLVALAIVLISYFIAGVAFGSSQTGRRDLLTRALMPVFSFPFHLCYGLGTIAGARYLFRDPAVPQLEQPPGVPAPAPQEARKAA